MSRKREPTEGVDLKILRRRELRRLYYKNNKRKHQEQMHKYNYGISAGQYQAMLAKQKGCCAICGIGENKRKGHENKMCVDHDHKTGLVRGLLCHRCNIVLGMIEKNFTVALTMMEYIRHWNCEAALAVS